MSENDYNRREVDKKFIDLRERIITQQEMINNHNLVLNDVVERGHERGEQIKEVAKQMDEMTKEFRPVLTQLNKVNETMTAFVVVRDISKKIIKWVALPVGGLYAWFEHVSHHFK